MISKRAKSVWAKTGGAEQWLPLTQHMLDSRAVAALLVEYWLSPQVRRRWIAHPLGSDGIGRIAVFLAAVHDVGKASPVFVAQSEPLAQRTRDTGLPCPIMDELRPDRAVLQHSVVSQHALRTWLIDLGLGSEAARGLASVIGAHHGRPVTVKAEKEAGNRAHATGGPAWAEVRTELLNWLADECDVRDTLLQTSDAPLPLPILVELSGFVVVADWLASNTRYFPLRPREHDGAPEPDMATRINLAWDDMAMPAPWNPNSVPAEVTELFRSRFGWEAPAAPRPVQRAVAEAARAADVGLMFIETMTGDGKTEAALAAAEIIAEQRGSQGLMIALPTQATTNAMFDRVTDWLRRLPNPPLNVPAWAITLGHGKSMLNPSYAEMARAFAAFDRRSANVADFSTMFDEPGPSNAVVHQWFLGSKRRLLSSFTIVTIDQLLMAGLQRRHLMLAHVGLSGKVVIIDEAHASDDFMNVYLDSVLSWLGAYEVPVIVLSATLTAERRRAMMRAYAPQRTAEIDAADLKPAAYPRLTVVPRGTHPITVTQVQGPKRDRIVEWSWHPTDLDALVASVRAAIADGGCALVVRNTVKDAQATADALMAAGLQVLLNHAGFLARDRADNDAELTGLFGPRAGDQRPQQAVVVGTQVVEQSLDVDFDVLFTDLAPIDLLVQRIGRLHRHVRVRPPHLQEPRVQILADLGENGLPHGSRGSEVVYGEHLLYRTAAALHEHGPTITLPGDGPLLVELVMGAEPLGDAAWQGNMIQAAEAHAKALREQRAKAAIWCVRSWDPVDDDRHHLGTWLATSNDFTEVAMGATVRDTEPSIEVVIVPRTPDGSAAVRPPWHTDGLIAETLDTSTLPTDDLAREIATWSVRLPGFMARYGRLEAVIAAVDQNPETRRWLWRRHPLLKGELLVPMNQIDEGSNELETTIDAAGRSFHLRYSPERGLAVEVTS